MIHVYRDHEFARERFTLPLYWTLFLLAGTVLSVATGAPLRVTAEMNAIAAGILSIALFFHHRHFHYGRCVEIRLGDDGTCELETKRRVVRLHVHEIRSVRYSPESDESSEHYIIRYRDGKVLVAPEMTGISDFLARVETLDPSVDTSGPRPERDESVDTRQSPSRRSALFPLLIVGGLVWLAIQTLRG